MSYAADGEFAARFPCEHSAWTEVIVVSRILLGDPEEPLEEQSRNRRVLTQVHLAIWAG